MKQIVISVSLIVVIVLAGIINTHMADERLGGIIDMLDMSEAYVDKGDWDTAEQFAMQAMYDWERSQTYLCIISRHSELDEINATVNRTMESLRCRDYTLFKTENTVLVGMLEHIYEMEQLNLENIL